LTLKSRLLGQDQAAIALIVSGETSDMRPIRPSIDRFLAAMGPPEKVAQALLKQARGR
jgi:hypothetical protein